MILAGLGGVLIAPLFQLQDFVFTLVVLGSLAAVVLGGLRSIPIAFAGGLLLGVDPEPRRGLQRRHPAEVPERPRRPPVVGAVPPRHRAAAVHRSRPLAARGIGGRRRPATRPPRGPVEAARAGSRGRSGPSSCSPSRWVVRVGLAAGRRLRPDRDRPEPGDGDHLPVVRRRHRHERPGQPHAGQLRDRRRLRRRVGAHPRLRRRHPGLRLARPAQLLLGGGDRRAGRGRARRAARVAVDPSSAG